jgi:hypothetical protein
MPRMIPCPRADEDDEPCTNPNCRIGLCLREEAEKREQAELQDQWRGFYNEELRRLKL